MNMEPTIIRPSINADSLPECRVVKRVPFLYFSLTYRWHEPSNDCIPVVLFGYTTKPYPHLRYEEKEKTANFPHGFAKVFQSEEAKKMEATLIIWGKARKKLLIQKYASTEEVFIGGEETLKEMLAFLDYLHPETDKRNCTNDCNRRLENAQQSPKQKTKGAGRKVETPNTNIKKSGNQKVDKNSYEYICDEHFEKGRTPRCLAKEFNCSRTKIRNIIRLDSRYKSTHVAQFDRETCEKIRLAHKNGMTIGKIQEKFNASWWTTKGIINKTHPYNH